MIISCYQSEARAYLHSLSFKQSMHAGVIRADGTAVSGSPVQTPITLPNPPAAAPAWAPGAHNHCLGLGSRVLVRLQAPAWTPGAHDLHHINLVGACRKVVCCMGPRLMHDPL